MADSEKEEKLKRLGDKRMGLLEEDFLEKYNDVLRKNYPKKYGPKLPKENEFKDISKYFAISKKEFAKKYCPWVSPITNWAHNPNPDIVFVLQDWASEEGIKNFEKENRLPELVKRGYNWTSDKNLCKDGVKTNENIVRTVMNMLNPESGSKKKPLDCKVMENFYITNLFPYIKPGSANARIPPTIMEMAFKHFCQPQIEILREDNHKMKVICLGTEVYRTFLRALKLPDFFALPGKDGSQVKVYCQDHPGRMYFETMKERWGWMGLKIK